MSTVVDNHDIKIAGNLSIILIEAKYNNVYFVCNSKGLYINNDFRECTHLSLYFINMVI